MFLHLQDLPLADENVHLPQMSLGIDVCLLNQKQIHHFYTYLSYKIPFFIITQDRWIGNKMEE